MTRDMTVGSPMKQIMSFLTTFLFGYLFQQFYAIADSIIVARTLGVADLAAVGSTNALNFLVIGCCIGITSGFGIPISQRFGAKDYASMRSFIWNLIPICLIIGFSLATVTAIATRPLLSLLHTPDDIIDHAVIYIRILFIGIPLCMLYNMTSSILQAIGDSRTPVYFLLFSSALNIALDLFLILVIPMGVAGAAWATDISQGAAGFLSLFVLAKKYPVVHPSGREKRIDMKKWRILLSNGLPMGLQYSITAIGSVILQSSINGLGSVVVAAVAAADRASSLFSSPLNALGATMAVYIGQNTGSGSIARIKRGAGDAVIIGTVYSAAALVAILLCGHGLIGLFASGDSSEIIPLGTRFLIIQVEFFFFLTIIFVCRFSIQGMGFGPFSIFSGVMELIARALFGLLVVPRWGFDAACYASPFAWILADIFLVPAFFHCTKKLQKMVTVLPLYHRVDI